jgi:hypothetical protein
MISRIIKNGKIGEKGEGMGDNVFRLVKVGEIIMIGEYAYYPAQLGRFINRPRLIGMQQTPTGNQRVFMELIGSPETIDIPPGALVWEPTDEALVNQYREAVTGLVLAKPNVISMVKP